MKRFLAALAALAEVFALAGCSSPTASPTPPTPRPPQIESFSATWIKHRESGSWPTIDLEFTASFKKQDNGILMVVVLTFPNGSTLWPVYYSEAEGKFPGGVNWTRDDTKGIVIAHYHEALVWYGDDASSITFSAQDRYGSAAPRTIVLTP